MSLVADKTESTKPSSVLAEGGGHTQASRKKRVLNKRLFAYSLAALLVAGPSLYFWHAHRVDKTADALLVRAEELVSKSDTGTAMTYYQRYLTLRPEDTDTLVRMSTVYAKGATDAAGIYRLTSLLYRTLGRVPERSDLRLLLAENELKLGNIPAAEEQAKQILSGESDDKAAARRIIAIAKAQRAEDGDRAAIRDAIDALISACDEFPGDSWLVVNTVGMLRRHADRIDRDQDATIKLADDLMDKLVAADPTNIEALVARYTYKRQYGLPNAEEDLEAALKLAPENVNVLSLAADAAFVREDFAASEKFLRRSLEIAPTDARPYLGLATLFKRNGNRRAAIELLEQGRELADQRRLEIGILLAGTLLDEREIDKAARLVKQLDSERTLELANRGPESIRVTENQIRLLSARVDLGRNQPHEAAAKLRSVLAAAGSDKAGTRSREALEATALLAQTMAALGHWDQSAHFWSVLAENSPNPVAAYRLSGEAYLRAGQPSKAISYMERFLESKVDQTSKADVSIQLLTAQSQAQMQLPAQQQNWNEYGRLLKEVKAEFPERWEVVLAEIDYLLRQAQPTEVQDSSPSSRDDSRRQAEQLMRAAEEKFATEPQLWQALVLGYQRLGNPADAERALKRFKTFEVPAVEKLRLEAAWLLSQEKAEECITFLTNSLNSLKDADRSQLEIALLKVLMQEGRRKEAQELAGNLADRESTSLQTLVTCAEVCLELGDFLQAKNCEATLRDKRPLDSAWKTLRVSRYLATYADLSSQDKQELDRLVSELRSERPVWYPIIALSARRHQLGGDVRQAVTDYILAVELGDRRLATIQSLVSLLYREDRASEAQQYVALLPVAWTPTEHLELLVKKNQLAEALSLAEESLEQNPKDPQLHLWRAQLLLSNNQEQAADEAFRKAQELFPDNMAIWNGLFSLHLRAGRLDEARDILKAFFAESSIPEFSKQAFGAQAYDLLKEPEKALASYEKAIELSPDHAGVRLGFAKFLQASNVAKAREQFEVALKLDPQNQEVQRSFAALLAATGSDADWARVEQLLGGDKANNISSQITYAIFLARKGIGRSERLANLAKAGKILDEQIQRADDQSAGILRSLYAQVLEQMAGIAKDVNALEAAREQRRALVDRADPSVSNLVLYVDFLLRYSDSDNSIFEDAASQARIREVYLGDAEGRIDELRSLVSSNTGSEEYEELIRLETVVLRERGRVAEAIENLQQFAERYPQESLDERKQTKFALTMAELYTSLGAHDEADRWYRKLTALTPKAFFLLAKSLADQGRFSDAAEVCLSVSNGELQADVAMTAIRLLPLMEPDSPPYTKLDSLVSAAVDRFPDNVQVLLGAAVLRVQQERLDEAITLFKQVIEHAPDNTLALNNLATLLAELPDRQAEAMEYIERALAVAGRQTALLDTQGTILLKSQRYAEAIACLEEATAGVALDPRYFFHLAAAYLAENRIADAGKALTTARELGLEQTLLTEGDRKLLADLDQQLSVQ